jgi:hypothetical protein
MFPALEALAPSAALLLALSLSMADPAEAVISAVDISCRERCEKWCMGNDTPTEIGECLKEKKSSKPICPPSGTRTGTKADPGRLEYHGLDLTG